RDFLSNAPARLRALFPKIPFPAASTPRQSRKPCSFQGSTLQKTHLRTAGLKERGAQELPLRSSSMKAGRTEPELSLQEQTFSSSVKTPEAKDSRSLRFDKEHRKEAQGHIQE